MTDVNIYMKGKKFFDWNVFAKGILSDNERKMPIQFYGENFYFFCKHADLLNAPVEISIIHPTHDNPFLESNWNNAFMHDFMNFCMEWQRYVWKRLNGYSGTHAINFEFAPYIKHEFINGFRID